MNNYTLADLPNVLQSMNDRIATLEKEKAPNRIMNVKQSEAYMGLKKAEFNKLRIAKIVKPLKLPGSTKFTKDHLDEVMSQI